MSIRSTVVLLIAAVAIQARASDSPWVSGQLIVKLAESARGQFGLAGSDGRVLTGVADLDYLNSRWHVTSWRRVARTPGRRCDLLYLLQLNPNADVCAAAADFGGSPSVEYACPNALLRLDGRVFDTPDDPRYPDQWALPRIRAPQAWQAAHGDSNVVIAVLDDGLYYPHGDIEANVWINSAEDINGNGRFDSTWYPDGDLDGVDQDGNGYIDDVIGFDFVDGDPIPMPNGTDDHGTACWGAANAVTDNGAGIAAAPWNVRAMGLRCGGGGYLNLAAAVSAIYYALDKGAWVFSMSFGSATPYQPLNDACQAIWAAGALSVASVGSEGIGYPAAYDNVVAVAASDSNDRRAAFSAYGSWIDVCAPGVQILTTSRNGYEYYDGTSVAAPIVAGVLAWYKSAEPGITNDSALSLLYACCDSMPDSLYRAGLLGHGRVAMTDSAFPGTAERRPDAWNSRVQATFVRRVFRIADTPGSETRTASLLDAAGRTVLILRLGQNDVSPLAPGVYFVVEEQRTASRLRPMVRKIVVAH